MGLLDFELFGQWSLKLLLSMNEKGMQFRVMVW